MYMDCLMFSPMSLNFATDLAVILRYFQLCFSVVLYAVSAVYFAGVMVRLMLTLTPVVCVLSAIAFSSTFDIYLDDTERFVGGKEDENGSVAKKSIENDSGKKKKKDKEKDKDRDSSDMVGFIFFVIDRLFRYFGMIIYFHLCFNFYFFSH